MLDTVYRDLGTGYVPHWHGDIVDLAGDYTCDDSSPRPPPGSPGWGPVRAFVEPAVTVRSRTQPIP